LSPHGKTSSPPFEGGGGRAKKQGFRFVDALWSRRIALTQPRSRLTESNPAASDVTEDLFVAYSQHIYAYCLRTLGSPEEAEDALQATYCNAWGSLKRGFEPRDARAWLFGIAHNACHTVLRGRARTSREQPRPVDQLDQAFGRSDPDHDRLIGLSRAIDSLPDKQKRALLLREWRGLSYAEVASELGVSLAAAETLIFRARNSVAAALDPAVHPKWRARLSAVGVAPLVLGDWTRGAVKSVFTSQVGTAKWAVGFALMTTAPLMVFGLGQASLERMGEGRRAQAVEPRPALAWGAPVGPAPTEVAPPVRRRVASQADNAATSGVAAATSGDGHAEPAPNGGPKPVTPPAVSPAPPGSGAMAKVTVCHVTGGGKTVTITIAEAALPTHLGHGDGPGACS
jgi:RNA polymerase sigma-70 factor, ECF subfamily